MTAYNAFQLARLADCGEPDTEHSPGARFLESVRDAVDEMIEYSKPAGMDEVADGIREIADGAPDVYTAARWAQFVDLAAWQEDLSEIGGGGEDMTGNAGLALYLIAERLATKLTTEHYRYDEDE